MTALPNLVRKSLQVLMLNMFRLATGETFPLMFMLNRVFWITDFFPVFGGSKITTFSPPAMRFDNALHSFFLPTKSLPVTNLSYINGVSILLGKII